MLNRSQENFKNSNQHPTTSDSSNMNAQIHEIQQMLKNQRLDSSNYSNQLIDPNTQLNHQNSPSNQMQLNYLKNVTNPISQSMSHLNQINFNLPNINQPINRSVDQTINLSVNHQNAFNYVPRIKNYMDCNYENLYMPNNNNQASNHMMQNSNYKPINYQSTANSTSINPFNTIPSSANVYEQQVIDKQNNFKQQTINHLNQMNRDLISPNVTGLPEVQQQRKQQNNSPSSQNNIYANSSIISRYCPTPSTKQPLDKRDDLRASFASAEQALLNTNLNTYKETSIDGYSVEYNRLKKLKDEIELKKTNLFNYSPKINNDSTYDPVYFRPNSQLSFNSLKDESSIYSTYAPSAGSRQPINALLNNELDNNNALDNNLVTNKSSGFIDLLKKEKEVDYLTNLLVQGMQFSSEPDYYGMCYKCGLAIYGEGCSLIGRTFHFDCFSTCHTCDKALREGTFYNMDGQFYCEACYLNSLEVCFKCAKPILDRVLRAMGNCYHPNCFTCCVCDTCLNGQHFTVDYKNRLYCIKDFNELYAPRCSVCNTAIMPENNQLETVRIVALDRCFHVNCYKCQDCGVLLSSEKDGKGCYPLDDLILCKECNNIRFQQYLSTNSTKLK